MDVESKYKVKVIVSISGEILVIIGKWFFLLFFNYLYQDFGNFYMYINGDDFFIVEDFFKVFEFFIYNNCRLDCENWCYGLDVNFFLYIRVLEQLVFSLWDCLKKI